jgi:septal ring-binding cell division protein DamX
MSAVESPTTPGEQSAAEPQLCPRCAAPLRPGQDWCLECGEAVSTRIAKSPGWRLPAAIVGTVLALGAAVLVLAFLELSDDADRAAATPAPTPTAVASAVPTETPPAAPSPTSPDATPAPSPAASPTPSPEASASPTPAPAGAVATWPAGEEAWTVVLLSSTGKPEAEKRAKEISDSGTPAGVLRSDDYESLREGYWVVFSGQYETQKEAQDAAEAIGAKAAGAYARFVKPR